jgi:hypothetical protein
VPCCLDELTELQCTMHNFSWSPGPGLLASQHHIKHSHTHSHTHTNRSVHSTRVHPTPSAEISVGLYQISSSWQEAEWEELVEDHGSLWGRSLGLREPRANGKSIEAVHIQGTLQLVAGHESQVSHCAKPRKKLWHHVLLCELPFMPTCSCLKDLVVLKYHPKKS